MILQTNDRQVEKEGRAEIQKFEYLENESQCTRIDCPKES